MYGSNIFGGPICAANYALSMGICRSENGVFKLDLGHMLKIFGCNEYEVKKGNNTITIVAPLWGGKQEDGGSVIILTSKPKKLGGVVGVDLNIALNSGGRSSFNSRQHEVLAEEYGNIYYSEGLGGSINMLQLTTILYALNDAADYCMKYNSYYD